MNIHVADSDEEIAACFPVMCELRVHLTEESFISQICSQELSGYRLAYLMADRQVVSVTGFRIGESLPWGRFLYVDDIVTRSAFRSKGYGAALLRWLEEVARHEACSEIHLDSGIEKTEAHRFYRREGMEVADLHFRRVLTPNSSPHPDAL
jgi:GNAT superfamily N-acetyltransferase